MRKVFLIFAGLLCSVIAFAQTNFQELSLEDACKKAKAENKPVFMDCYTSWCGPCRRMANEVFTLEAAGDYFNKNFVCVKTDMEKGDSPAIGKQYGVDAYPTFLLINSDGRLMHKIVGAMSLEELIENIENGLKANGLVEYEVSFQAGKLDKTEQMTYWKLLSGSGEVAKAQTVGDDLWGKLSEKDKLNSAYWPLVRLRATTVDGEEMKFVCANRKYFEKEVGKEKVGELIYNSFITELNMMILYQLPAKKYEKVPSIKNMLENNDVPRKEALLKMAELAEARGNHDGKGYLDILGANQNVWNDAEKRTVFEGANLFIPLANSKELTKRLGKIALQAQESVKDEVVREIIIKLGLVSRRMSGKDGVYWEELPSLKEVLEQASLEERYVLLDFHQDGQTAQLIDEKIFSRKEVGDCLNKFFINYKIEIDRGEGPKIARRYGVIVPNVVVVLDKDGEVRHRMPNLMNGDFIERVNETFDDNKAVGALEMKYNMGDRSTELMLNYLTALTKMSSNKASLIAVELFASLDDKQRTSPEYWILYHPRFSDVSLDMKNYLFSNIQEFRENLGEQADELAVYQINVTLNEVLYNSNTRTSVEDIDKYILFIKQNKLRNAEKLLCLANIVKLYKNNVCNLKAYKKASKGMTPEEIPFADLYMRVSTIDPGRMEEWKAWGEELMNACTNENMKLWYGKFVK